ncbi:MAG: ABC transporter permease [Anaerolineales bacterium]|nr:ABC transporter permease [Anaerolineales bacterium]
MIQNLRTLYQHRELMWAWMLRDIRVRYKQSLLGAAWAVLQPLSIMAVFSVIFGYIVPVPTDGTPYPVFSYTALLPWTFFSTAISFAVPSLVNNMSLVTKVYMPREIFPLAAVAGSFVDFLVAAVVYAGLMLAYRMPVTVTLIAVPALLLIQVLLTLGVVLFAAALNVFYRDVRFLVPLGLQLWMYATPIIYPVSVVPAWLRPLYMLNPMTGLIEAYRAVALYGTWPDWASLAPAAGLSVLLFVFGYVYFKTVEWQFADII